MAQPDMKIRSHRRRMPVVVLVLIGLVLGMALLAAASLGGAVPAGFTDLWAPVANPADPAGLLRRAVFLEIRLPRVLFSAVAGAGLAIAGTAMQALFRNPLAEPGLVGVSAGAALGAALAIVVVPGGGLVMMAAAFSGSLGAIGLAYAIGRRYRDMSGLLLAGIGVNAVALSAIGLLTYLASSAQLRDMAFWSLGSLAGADWTVLGWLGPWTLLWCVYLCHHWKVLNALLLGEREALHLGFRLVAVRRRLVLAIALMVGPLVAVTGGIGFVGLVVPHVMRLIIGPQHRYLLPGSVLAGALLLVLADWLARTVIAPAELPIGMLTSLVGGPFFFWLLLRRRVSREA